MAEAYRQHSSIDGGVMGDAGVMGRIFLGAAVALTMIAIVRAIAFHWGDVIGGDFDDTEFGGKQIPKEYEKDGVSDTPEECSHGGMLRESRCHWCGAKLS